MHEYLQSSIEYLKGVGPAKGDLLKGEKSIFTYEDLLMDYPYRYIDKTQILPISMIKQSDEAVLIKGRITDIHEAGSGRKVRLHATLQDQTGQINLVWFQGIRYWRSLIQIQHTYLCYGKVSYFNGQKNMSHPELEPVTNEALKQLSLRPMYSSTEKLDSRGLNSKGQEKLKRLLIDSLRPEHIQEYLPDYLMKKLRLPTKYQAIKNIHFPSSTTQLSSARNRLVFEELFFMQLQLWKRYSARKAIISYAFDQVGDYVHTFYDMHLPFELTNAQKRVIKEIRSDLGSGQQMNRLLQGDVGSGKTIVALMSILIALDNQYQSCLLAPTEILAQQHYNSIRRMAQPLGLDIALLTGQVKGRSRREILERLVSGELHILIGTHAILEDNVQFHRLGLAIIDEQHRFGVAQRAKLWAKASPHPPHILIMSATPIPRTLAMTVYGDLDVSVIDELPPGRKPIHTSIISDRHRSRMYEFIKDQIADGRQVYVVYPIIEESEKLDLAALDEGYERMLVDFPRPTYQMSIVHGRMKTEDKDYEMQRFANGDTQILVATTVIEVGVDVPNATIMIIENAERFGLSQLHQLRGRVGRGGNQSYCFLIPGVRLTKVARERLKIMTETNDGFKIAEADLHLRGPGDIEGVRQSGDVSLQIANPITDKKTLETARQIVQYVLSDDPNLEKSINDPLRRYIQHYKNLFDWSVIS